MICNPCKAAGRLLHAWPEPLSAPTLAAIKTYHLHCEYPSTCTCQHITGKMVNTVYPVTQEVT